MSLILDEIGAYLENENIGSLDNDLFLGTMPDTPDEAVSVYEYSGASPIDLMGPGLPPIERPRIQVVARGLPHDYVGPRQKMDDAWRALAVVLNEDLSSVSYLRVTPLQSPALFSRDAKERVLFVCNFECMRELPAAEVIS